jgi:hypothetical protein
MKNEMSVVETTRALGSRRTEGNVFTLGWGAEVEQWPEAVEGKVLLDELEGLLRRYVVLPKWAAETLALWVLHTYAFQLREVSTYIGIGSPEKRCGKTTLLSVLSELVHRPVVAANISSPAFFRVIEETQPTLLIDEADTFLQGNDELRGILNSGYTRKTAYVVRVAWGSWSQDGRWDRGREEERCYGGANSSEVLDPSAVPTVDASGRGSEGVSALALRPEAWNAPRPGQGQGSRLARFSCWCPKVMAAIGRLPDTLADRCIVIEMQRKTAGERCERLRTLDTSEVRRKCLRFVRDHEGEIARAHPEPIASLNDRAGDIWEPLLVLADLAGGEWPLKGRNAAEGLTASAQETAPHVSLLMDIFFVLMNAGGERIFSRELVAGLNRFGERPWAALRKGRQITELWLAQQLRPYGIRPKTMWIGESAAKGYEQVDFHEVLRRYVPRTEFEALKAPKDGKPVPTGSSTNTASLPVKRPTAGGV